MFSFVEIAIATKFSNVLSARNEKKLENFPKLFCTVLYNLYLCIAGSHFVGMVNMSI